MRKVPNRADKGRRGGAFSFISSATKPATTSRHPSGYIGNFADLTSLNAPAIPQRIEQSSK